MTKRSMFISMMAVAVCGAGVARAAWRGADGVPSFHFAIDANSVLVRSGQEVLLRYQYGKGQPKPYVKELLTPDGRNVLLDSPPDHVHHHGLMFACNVNGIDFWADQAAQTSAPLGREEHQRFPNIGEERTAGRSWVGLEEHVDWVSPRDGPLLSEQRAVRVTRFVEPKAAVLTWQCKFAVASGQESVVLTGSHYHGLGMRFIRAMDAAGPFRNADNEPGVVFRGEERLVRSNWCAYTATVEGRDVTVAMFGHPDNPRHPTTWFTMAKPFAYMSATLRLHEEPLKVLAGKPLSLRYGVALWDGRAQTSQIDALYGQWVALAKGKSEE